MTTQKTPLMKQYDEMKKKHPDAVLLFRVGYFYETFREDAAIASEILGLTLTRQQTPNGCVELTGFPYHALDTYLPKLVRAGKRVAICEQLEDPKQMHPKVKKMLNEEIKPAKPAKQFDFTTLISFIIATFDAIRQLSIVAEIIQKSRELKQLLRPLGLTDREIYDAFVAEKYYQPSLFD